MRLPILTMKLGHIALVSLMLLLAQASVAAHDLEHQAEDHTEHCQIYLTADQTSLDTDILDVGFHLPPFAVLSTRSYFFIPHGLISAHQSRAPPFGLSRA